MDKTARLHPLLTAAAISVTAFSAVGIGAMTGLLPSSLGSAKDAAPTELVATPVPPAAPAVETKPADMPPAAPKATPKPVKKVVKIVKSSAPAAVPAPAQDFGETPRVAQAPAAIEAPKPVPAGILGVVEAVREVKTKAETSNGVGPIAGGVGGAVLGSQIGKGFDSKGFRNVLTVLGAAGGAFAGKEIERNVRATSHWEVDVRLDDGTQRTLSSSSAPYWQPGHRVRFLDGALQPA
jgi:outer membrane lipoprotein SlyB